MQAFVYSTLACCQDGMVEEVFAGPYFDSLHARAKGITAAFVLIFACSVLLARRQPASRSPLLRPASPR